MVSELWIPGVQKVAMYILEASSHKLILCDFMTCSISSVIVILIVAIPGVYFIFFSDFPEYIRMYTRKFVVKLRAERFLSRVNRLRGSRDP